MRVSKLATAIAFTFAGSLVLACGGDDISGPRNEPRPPHFAISDAVFNGGNPHFYFLPPMVPKPTFAGTSDATLAPRVTVCEWTADLRRCGTVIADFGVDSGTGSETVRYDPASEHYIVNWDTKSCVSGGCTLDPSKNYRLRVLVGQAELGFADVKPVTNGSELKNAATGESVALVNGRTLPVKFRIEQGAVMVVTAEGSVTVDATGGTVAAEDGTAALKIPAGAVSSATRITITDAIDAPAGIIEGLAPVVELGPDGTQFSVPVQLTLPFDGSKLPPGVPPSALAIYTTDGTGWREVAGSIVDEATGTVSALIEHFSVYSLRIVPNTVSGVPAPVSIDVGQFATVAAQAIAYHTQYGYYCYPRYASSGGWGGGFYIAGYTCFNWTHVITYPVANEAVSWSSENSGIAFVQSGPTYTDAAGVAVSPPILGISPGVTGIYARAVGLISATVATVTEGTVVRTTSDDGAGSLRRVLANAAAGSTITFAESLTDVASANGSCSTLTVPGCTIRLASPLTIARNITIDGPASPALLTLDGGHTTGTTGVQVFIINSGNVTVRRVTIARGHAPSQGGGVFVQAGTVVFDSCRIINSHATAFGGGLGQGGGLYNQGGNVTLVSTEIAGDTASAGGALYNYNFGTLILVESSVGDSYASNIGGGILNFGRVTVTSSTIRGNRAANQGGGIYNFAVAQLTMSGSALLENRAALGAGLYNYSNGIVTIGTNSQVTRNTATTNGGGIYNDGSLTINADGAVVGNRAANQGGGVFNGIGTVAMTSGLLRGNRATGESGGLAQGGGIYNSNGTVTLAGVTVEYDTAAAGGALYNYNFGTFNVTAGTDVAGSYGTNIGGGIINFGTVRITGSTVRGNRAANQGGGIYNFAVAQLMLTQSAVEENSAPLGGGLYNYHNGIVTVAGSEIARNTATTNGGGVHNDGSLTIDAESAVRANRAANQGGGIFNGAGAVTVTGAALDANVATGGNGGLAQGGAVYNQGGTVTLVGASASGDSAAAGGALYNYNFGTLNVTAGSSILDSYASNVGGGIINFGTVQVRGSTVRRNSAVNQGGGIYNFALGRVTLTGTELSSNTAGAGGGLYNYSNGIVTLTEKASVCNNTASNPPLNIANLGSLFGTNHDAVGSSVACPVP